MQQKRVIAAFTGNRAEYGLLQPILASLRAHPKIDFRLIVSGAHLDANFGRTLAEIEQDGYSIDAEVKIDIDDDTLFGTARAIGSGVLSMSQALARIKPDMLVVYADRFEGFAAIIAGTQMGIPTAHIEGGDVTEGGALDDSVRHAMTKLAHLHLTTNEEASNRIKAMGEEPWRVHTVGFPVIDLIVKGIYAKPEELRQQLGIDPERPLILVTQHSVTTEAEQAVDQVRPLIDAIRRLASEGVQCLVTYPNNDAGGRRIGGELERLAAEGLPNITVRRSVGRYNYHGVLALALDSRRKVACVGNSSSGIKETPAFGCPTVNVGSRQQSRLRSTNVIDTGYDADEIYAAVRRCFDDQAFRATCRTCDNPYGMGNTGPRVAEILSNVVLDARLLRKMMTIRGEQRDDWYR